MERVAPNAIPVHTRSEPASAGLRHREIGLRIGVLGLAVAFALTIHLKTAADQRLLRHNFRADAAIRAEIDGRHLQDVLHQIYQTLRVIAGLPGIRAIDTDAKNLSTPDRETIQRLYDNLFDAVHLSEIYVVPRDLDIDGIAYDRPQKPIISFDSNIVGSARPGSTHAEEIETFEYRAMQRDLIPWMAAHVPRLTDIQGLALPLLSSPTVLTCDNVDFDETRRDADREGVVLAVPFYGSDGVLKGIVTAVLRSNVLRGLLPEHDAALTIVQSGVLVAATRPGQAEASRDWVARGLVDPALIFSRTFRLDLPDPRTTWLFWAGRPDAEFFDSPEIRSSRTFAWVSYAVAALVAGLAWVILGERRDFERKVTRLAFHDALTGLPNRRLMCDRLEQALLRALRRGGRVGLVYLDLDNFKLINDSLGHGFGDDLLLQVADRLCTTLRAEDTVARLGGDEFVVVLPDLAADSDVMPVIRAIERQFHRPFRLHSRTLTVTASTGVAFGDLGLRDPDTLLRNADLAMHAAKSEGRARTVIFNASMHSDALTRLELESDLRRAIERGELRVHYQPIVWLASGELAGVEALVRWQHPRRGLISPGEFIAVAEETGLVVPLGRFVLKEACRQMAAWQARPGNVSLSVSVNLSPRQFLAPNLLEVVETALRDSGLPPAALVLEITEGVVMQDNEPTARTLAGLKALGLRLAIDDFGTGYSSLASLRSLPLDILKIDRSFVTGLGREANSAAFVQAIISLAASLHLTVTVEGVETETQGALLRALGCERAQGYYFGRPMEAAMFAARLEASPSCAAIVLPVATEAA